VPRVALQPEEDVESEDEDDIDSRANVLKPASDDVDEEGELPPDAEPAAGDEPEVELSTEAALKRAVAFGEHTSPKLPSAFLPLAAV